MGTSGDVLPALAVAQEVASLGARVHVATHRRFLSAVRPPVTSSELPYDPLQVLETRAGRWLLNGGALGLKRALGAYGVLRSRIPDTFYAVHQIAQRADLLVYSGIPIGAQYVIDAVAPASVRLYLSPHWPTSENKSLHISMPGDWGPRFNWYSHILVERAARATFGSTFRRTLATLGIPEPEPAYLLDTSYWTEGVSIFALPPQFANASIRERANARPVGFIRPDRSLPEPDDAVLSHLHDTPKPRVLMTFGSMVSPSVDLIDTRLCELARRGEISLVRQIGWKHLRHQEPDKNIITVPPSSHARLMAECDVVVHHGGVGTVSACLEAQRPMLICPLWLDQFHLAALCEKLGVAIRIKPRATDIQLLDALTRASLDLRDVVRSVGPQLLAYDGRAAGGRMIVGMCNGGRFERSSLV